MQEGKVHYLFSHEVELKCGGWPNHPNHGGGGVSIQTKTVAGDTLGE